MAYEHGWGFARAHPAPQVDHVRAQRAQKDLLAKRPRPLEFHRRNLIHLYAQIQATLDRMTANVMQYLDKVARGVPQAPEFCIGPHFCLACWGGGSFPPVCRVPGRCHLGLKMDVFPQKIPVEFPGFFSAFKFKRLLFCSAL